MSAKVDLELALLIIKPSDGSVKNLINETRALHKQKIQAQCQNDAFLNDFERVPAVDRVPERGNGQRGGAALRVETQRRTSVVAAGACASATRTASNCR